MPVSSLLGSWNVLYISAKYARRGAKQKGRDKD